MKVNIRILIIFAFVLCFSVSTFASNGKIPIYQPTTIVASGSYYLTADIPTIFPAIVIDADYVTLDLQGHTVNGDIQVPQPHTNIRITNGKVEGGGSIDMQQGGNYYRVDNLQIDTGNITIGAGTHMIVEFNSVQFIFFTMVSNGRIASNTVSNDEGFIGIDIMDCRNLEVMYNTVNKVQFEGIHLGMSHDNTLSYNDSSENGANGLMMDFSNNNKITHNNFSENVFNGIMAVDCRNNTIAYNVISANDSGNQGFANGILLDLGDANYINHNSISGNEVDGIQANGSTNTKIAHNNASSNRRNGFNLINNAMNNSLDWNHAANNVIGFNFDGTTMQNIYSNNRAPGNTVAGYLDAGINMAVVYGAGFPTNF